MSPLVWIVICIVLIYLYYTASNSLSDANSEIASLRDSQTKTSADIVDLTARLDKKTDELKRLTDQLNDEIDQHAKFQTMYQDSDSKLKKVTADYQALKGAASSAVGSVSYLTQNVNTLTQQLADLRVQTCRAVDSEVNPTKNYSQATCISNQELQATLRVLNKSLDQIIASLIAQYQATNPSAQKLQFAKDYYQALKLAFQDSDAKFDNARLRFVQSLNLDKFSKVCQVVKNSSIESVKHTLFGSGQTLAAMASTPIAYDVADAVSQSPEVIAPTTDVQTNDQSANLPQFIGADSQAIISQFVVRFLPLLVNMTSSICDRVTASTTESQLQTMVQNSFNIVRQQYLRFKVGLAVESYQLLATPY